MSGYKTRPINLDQYKGAFVWVDAIIAELESEREKSAALLVALEAQRYKGGCFCEVSIGNPMYRGHSESCVLASETLVKYRGAK